MLYDTDLRQIYTFFVKKTWPLRRVPAMYTLLNYLRYLAVYMTTVTLKTVTGLVYSNICPFRCHLRTLVQKFSSR